MYALSTDVTSSMSTYTLATILMMPHPLRNPQTMDEVLIRQPRTLSLLSSISSPMTIDVMKDVRLEAELDRSDVVTTIRSNDAMVGIDGLSFPVWTSNGLVLMSYDGWFGFVGSGGVCQCRRKAEHVD